jgi:regulator of replication initiation timing
MKEALMEQYNSIRKTIKSNVETIGQLVAQAEALKKIVSSIAEPTVKLSIEKNIAEIETTIGSLIHQTDELFDQYQRFVEKVFSQK